MGEGWVVLVFEFHMVSLGVPLHVLQMDLHLPDEIYSGDTSCFGSVRTNFILPVMTFARSM